MNPIRTPRPGRPWFAFLLIASTVGCGPGHQWIVTAPRSPRTLAKSRKEVRGRPRLVEGARGSKKADTPPSGAGRVDVPILSPELPEIE